MTFGSQIEFLLGSNQRYFPGLLVAVLSALKSLNREVSCRFTIIDGGLELESREFLRNSFYRMLAEKRQEGELVFAAVDLENFRDLPSIWGESTMAYARILAPSLIPADDAIWIDSDMIVFKDLSFVANEMRGSDALIAAAEDPWVTLISDAPPDVDVSAFPEEKYVNTGLMWMNLKKMRQEGFSESLLKRMREWSDSLKHWDQTAINYGTLGRKQIIPNLYNTLIHHNTYSKTVRWVNELGNENVHFATEKKPWLADAQYHEVFRTILFYRIYSILTKKKYVEPSDRIKKQPGGITWIKSLLRTFFFLVTGNATRYREWSDREKLGRSYFWLRGRIYRRVDEWAGEMLEDRL